MDSKPTKKRFTKAMSARIININEAAAALYFVE